MLRPQICLEGVAAMDAGNSDKFREIHTAWLEQRDAAAARGSGGEGGDGTVAGEVIADIATPVAFAPQDLPIAVDIDIPPPILHDLTSPSVFHDVDTPIDTSANARTTAPSSPTLSTSTVSDFTPTELEDSTEEGDGERSTTRHETFYLEDGNVEVVCGHTIFRIHSPIVSFSSSKLRDVLSPSILLNAPMAEGCPRIAFEDSPEDFAVLLKMIYTPGFPARHKVPEFETFASLLRMSTKYGFSDVREQLVEDLKGAYPTNLEDFEAAKVLGEDIFGLPKPHPNAVLNLFLEQNIKFALPFAAYRASLGGFSALISDEPGTALPRLTLASVVRGREVTTGLIALVAHDIVYLHDLGVCPDRSCVLNVGIDSTEGRRDALKRIFHAMVARDKCDVLSPLSLGTLVCVNCANRMEKAHRFCRAGFFWTALPSLFGLGSWEGV